MAIGGVFAMLSASKVFAAEPAGSADLLTLCLATLPEARPDRIWKEWSFAPVVFVPVALVTMLYVRGLTAQRAAGEMCRPTLSQSTLFAAGIGCLVIALMSPLCRMASTLAWAHMIQHVLLVAGAPCSSP
jgi:hypothetical protein